MGLVSTPNLRQGGHSWALFFFSDSEQLFCSFAVLFDFFVPFGFGGMPHHEICSSALLANIIFSSPFFL